VIAHKEPSDEEIQDLEWAHDGRWDDQIIVAGMEVGPQASGLVVVPRLVQVEPNKAREASAFDSLRREAELSGEAAAELIQVSPLGGLPCVQAGEAT
jgi:hypothetical protein